MTRRKPREERKETVVRARVTDEQKAIMERAAAAAGLDLSSWLRFIALREAAARDERKANEGSKKALKK